MDFMILVPIIVLLICFFLRIPIAFSMLTSAVAWLLLSGKSLGPIIDAVIVPLYSSPTIIAAPLFIFTANIMTSSKVTDYMYTFCKAMFRGKRGATAYMNVIVSLIFSGMSGSAVADAAGSGLMEINEMTKDGYDRPFACALSASTAVVGPIFPPSIQMVVFAMLSGAAVGKLFMGGIIPALIIVAALMVYVWFISRRRNYPCGPKYTLKDFLKFSLRALPALLTPVILLGGIYSGVVTTTESGVLAAFYAILISAFVYRTMGIKELLTAIKDTIIQTGIVMACLACAYALNFVVVQSGLGILVRDFVLNITHNPTAFMLIVNLILLICGCFFPTEIATFVITPILLPIVQALNIDLVYFGVITSINIILGNVTPPFGFLCFVVSGMTGESLSKVFKEITPMVIILLALLVLFTLMPWTVTCIPSIM